MYVKRTDTRIAKPFVKWVGGKTQLLNKIENFLPKGFSEKEELTYVEPFVGGGSVLFWILQRYSNIKRAIINDINAELICTYRVIRDDVNSLIEELKKLQTEYLLLGNEERKDFFLKQRTLFNTKNTTDIQTATLFIFLNKTCFNGLYRVNSKGQFNVPFGRYETPNICDEITLRADSKLLQKVEILCGDFEQTEQYAENNVFYYLDPPYRPLTKTSTFTSYASNGFNDIEQIRLCNFCNRITEYGSVFIESNSDPKSVSNSDLFFDKLYETFNIKRVSATRMINSKSDGRGSISEIMISNIKDVHYDERF